MIVDGSGVQPVVVESAKISTEITGRIAVTTYDLVFNNPNGRVLEGTFEFPLLEGQQVIRFGLDINGTLREAVPVEKEKGRVTFEEIERRRVDPGLLEKTAGNNYRARVFPLPPRGTRRIVIAYQEDLKRGTSGNPLYRLALDFPGKLKDFSLDVKIHSAESSLPSVSTTLPLELPKWTDARLLSVSKQDFEARGILELVLPVVDRQTLMTQVFGDREYFYAEVPVPSMKPVARPVPRSIGILWDASGSGRERDHAKEMAFLDQWFKQVPNVEVHLYELRNVVQLSGSFQVKHGDWAGLRKHLESIVYDGGTSLDGMTEIEGVDEWLMFSDGVFNFGYTLGKKHLSINCPVHAVVATPRADTTGLYGLIRPMGGSLVNLVSLDSATAVSRVRTVAPRILKVDRDPTAVAQVFPSVGAPVVDADLSVTGILRKPKATVKITIGTSMKDSREIEVPLVSGASPGRLAARAWATAKIADLSLDPEDNRQDLLRTSKEFGIVTADTSLIVLETVQDYVTYDIRPPADLLKEWESIRQSQSIEIGKVHEAHLDRVASLFRKKEQWWETDFPKGRYKPAREKKAEPSHLAERNVGPPALSVPPPPEEQESEEVFKLSPFEVQTADDLGYFSTNTVSGTSLSVPLADIPMSMDVENLEYAAGVQPASTISLQKWNPEAGYLDRIKKVEPAERYGIYLEELPDHLEEAGFYMDVANFLFEAGEQDQAIRILSNLAELQLESAPLLRVLAHRLTQAGEYQLAVPLFEVILSIRGEEPQSYRNLALACAADQNYQRAVDLLWTVVEKPWDERFPEIELIALGELNAIVATCGESLDLSKVDRRFRKNLPVGLRIILTWDADNCDIDLWVDDPNGERAIYSNPMTYQGGRLSSDFTGGYGPEEFLLRDPKPGKYTVRINYYGERRFDTIGPVTAQVRLITGFGTMDEKEKTITVRLDSSKDQLEIGSIEIGEQDKR